MEYKTKECPICHNQYKMLSSHIQKAHKDFYLEQVKLVEQQINNLDIDKKTDLLSYK